ncbi:MAG: hypothetical protein GY774_20860 [Planctomycetes bacterium]|nr:hypothetical protein [Planctomycetota bacterium]
MANITYSRTFEHDDWIDNEDVVQAGGEKGFNKKFHEIEDELDQISTVVGQVDNEIQKTQRLNFVKAESSFTLASNTTSAEFPVETYDRSNLPPNVEKVYFVIIFPVFGPKHIQHTILYNQLPGNQIAVSVQFYNPGATSARLSFRVLTLAVQV